MVEEATRNLGIKEDSVKKRVRRGKMHSEKDEDSRLYVYVDRREAVRYEYADESEDLYVDPSVGEPTATAGELIAAKEQTIRILREQLHEEH